MSDLIAYQEMTKSSRKMKSYMDQLEGSLTPEEQESIARTKKNKDKGQRNGSGDEIEELSQSEFS